MQLKNSIETCTKYKEERANIRPRCGKLVIKYHSNTPNLILSCTEKLKESKLITNKQWLWGYVQATSKIFTLTLELDRASQTKILCTLSPKLLRVNSNCKHQSNSSSTWTCAKELI